MIFKQCRGEVLDGSGDDLGQRENFQRLDLAHGADCECRYCCHLEVQKGTVADGGCRALSLDA